MLAVTFCLGSGSAFMWPAWQASMSGLVEPDEVEAAATLNKLIYGAMLVVMSFVRSLALLVPLIVCGGMAWSATVSTLNAAAQSSFPAHIHARTLSIYLFVMAAGYTVGSLVWGRVADHFGVQAAFATAGACVIINAIVLALARREKPL